MKKQHHGVDIAKLLLAACIIAIHTKLFGNALFPMLRLSVPVFFIFTGYFAFAKINAAPAEQQKGILWNIEKRYLKLYLFWFIVLLPYTLYHRNPFSNGLAEGILQFFKYLVLGSTFPTSWYLAACMLGIAIVFFLSKAHRLLPIAVGVSAYLFATFVSKYRLVDADAGILHQYSQALCRFVGAPYNNVFIGLVYIVLGKMLAEQKFNRFTVRRSTAGFAVCFAALLAEFYLASGCSWFYPRSDSWFMLAPAAFFLTLTVMNLNLQIKHASTFRKISVICYCSHMPLISIVLKLFSVLNIADPHNILAFCATAFCVTTLSFIIFRLERCPRLKFLQYSH